MNRDLTREQYESACRFCPHVKGEINMQEGSKRTLLFQLFEKVIPLHCYLWDLMTFADAKGFKKYIEKKTSIPTNCPKRDGFRQAGYTLPE